MGQNTVKDILQDECPKCVVIVAAAWRVEVVQIVEFY